MAAPGFHLTGQVLAGVNSRQTVVLCLISSAARPANRQLRNLAENDERRSRIIEGALMDAAVAPAVARSEGNDGRNAPAQAHSVTVIGTSMLVCQY